MAYEEKLAARVRDELAGVVDVAEKKMFGGVSWLLGGNLAVGVIGDELCVRVGPDAFDEAVALPGARVFDFAGRPMNGWVMVDAAGVGDDLSLSDWVGRGLDFAGSLPPK